MAYQTMTRAQIVQSIQGKLQRHFGCELADATQNQLYQAVASTVRDEIMQRRAQSRGVRTQTKSKNYIICRPNFWSAARCTTT